MSVKSKLELKHLAPYLPYGLQVRWDHYRESEPTFVMTCKNLSDIEHDRYELCPLLRPLSDLTKEIEHNGEKIIAFNYILEWCAEYKKRYPGRKILDNGANGWAITESIKPTSLSYTSIQPLFEWHFDVFNLIESGLALDKKR